VTLRRTTRGLWLSAHPIPTIGVTAISAGLAALADLDLRTGLLFTAVVLLGQLSIGWSNDALDAARDRASGRSDKPVASGSVPQRTVAGAAVAALLAAVALSLPLGPRSAVATSTLAVAGWLYNLGLKNSALSFLPYAVGFAALPAGAVLARPDHPWPAWWLPAAGAVLGIAAHAANVLPDLEADRATGVNGFFHHLGARATAVAGPVLLVLASALALFGPGEVRAWKWSAIAAIMLLAGVGLAVGITRPGSKVLFLATIVLAGIDLLLFASSGTAVT